MPPEAYVATLATELPAWSPLMAFFAPLIGGEAAVLMLAFLSGQGILPLANVIIGSTLGMLALDAFWFAIPRTRWGERFKDRLRVSDRYRDLESRIEQISNHHDIIILFMSKILLGTRILILAYLSLRSISFRRFILYDAVATFLWALILGGAGWMAGLGYYSFSLAEHFFATLIYLVLFVAVVYGTLWMIRRWMTTRPPRPK